MIMTVKQLMDFSWMSQASYLDFSGLEINATSDIFAGRLKSSTINAGNIFTPGQATTFTDPADGYSFINYKPNDWTGFSATVFKNNSTTNDYTIAVRGTEPTFFQNLTGAIADLLNTDAISVSLQGVAYEQVISAYRYYKQLVTTPGAQVSYSQAELDKLCEIYRASFTVLLDNPITSGTLDVAVNTFRDELLSQALPENVGLGGITDTTATIHFTGHSLGGHVATLLATLVQQFGSGNVADITTYNSPGEGGLLGIDTVIGAATMTPVITNIIGEDGLEVTAALGQVYGATHNIFIEDSGAIAGNLLMENHSIVKLSDSLAVYNLFATLDPTLNDATLANLNTITDILKAETSIAANTLEGAVSALGKLFNVPGATFTGSAFDGAGRDKLYTALDAIQTTFQSRYSSVSIVALDTATLQADAGTPDANGSAYRYALVNLNPFAVLGADYSAHNTNGELDRYNPATGEGQITDAYLADRAAMLGLMIQRNMDDSSTIGGDILYRDVEQKITLRPAALFADEYALQQIIFGGAAGNTLTGGDNHDRLYGMDGADTLKGNGGDGNDVIFGGAGENTIYAGGGDTYIELSDKASETSSVYGGKGTDNLFVEGGGNTLIGDNGRAARCRSRAVNDDGRRVAA